MKALSAKVIGVVAQSTLLHQIDLASDKRGQPAIERPQDENRTHLIVYSNTQSEEACNHDYYDHDADDVENVHCALLLRYARTSV